MTREEREEMERLYPPDFPERLYPPFTGAELRKAARKALKAELLRRPTKNLTGGYSLRAPLEGFRLLEDRRSLVSPKGRRLKPAASRFEKNLRWVIRMEGRKVYSFSLLNLWHLAGIDGGIQKTLQSS